MISTKVSYLGDLRTKCTHLKSESSFFTDAPTDNKGKGEAFSPTDLIAASYASCMLTIIGIYCNANQLNFIHGEVEVIKEMSASPRSIKKLTINLDLSGNNWSEIECDKIEIAANNCPVALTLEGNIETELKYTF
ncbi:MAG: OsmC family protein [Lishizhenia sp.]